MHKEIVKELLDAVQAVQRKSVRLGGRIQLAAYRAPDDTDVQFAVEDLRDLHDTLDYIGERLSETLNGPYLIAEYVPERKGLVLTNYEPMDYREAAETAENLNLLGCVGYLQPISEADVRRHHRWVTVLLDGETGEIKTSPHFLALPTSQGLEQAQKYAEIMNDSQHVTDPNNLDYYAAATYEAVYGEEVRIG